MILILIGLYSLIFANFVASESFKLYGAQARYFGAFLVLSGLFLAPMIRKLILSQVVVEIAEVNFIYLMADFAAAFVLMFLGLGAYTAMRLAGKPQHS